MQLFLLDEDPLINAYLLPECYLWPMTKELGQLISSVLHKRFTLTKEEISSISNCISQGPELRDFIIEYSSWIYIYYCTLILRLEKEKGWNETKPALIKAYAIQKCFKRHMTITYNGAFVVAEELEYGHFRYSSEYTKIVEHYKYDGTAKTIVPNLPSKDTKVPIAECVQLYKTYLDWKMK